MVLVTGGSGHIGGNLVRALLQEKKKVRVLVHNDTRALKGLDVELVRGDILDPASLAVAVQGCSTVYHLGGIVSVESEHKDRLFDVNINGTRNMVNACLSKKVKRLVHFSSIHAIGGLNAQGQMDETCSYAGDSNCLPYNQTKASGEKEIQKGIQKGLDAVIVNPTSVIGMNDFKPSHMGQLFIDLYRGKFPVLIRAGFDWVDVRDVALGAILAEKKGRKGERYILSGHYLTIMDLCRVIEKETGRKMPRIALPIKVAALGIPFMKFLSMITGKRPLLTAGSLSALSEYKPICNTKAARELGYRARPIDETIRDTFEWFRKEAMI